MLFKILKLFGLDVRAEVAAVKNQIDQRVEDIAERAKHVALSTALIIALSTFAGLFLTMAIGVGLIALYQTEAATYGVNLALAIVAAVLVVATLILILAAWVLGRSLSNKRSPELTGSRAANFGMMSRRRPSSRPHRWCGSPYPQHLKVRPSIRLATLWNL